MEKSIIKELYLNFINSQEYERESQEIDASNDADILWLKKKLSFEEVLKLEETLVAYSSRNGRILFENGFHYAWKLFHELAGITVNAETMAVREDSKKSNMNDIKERLEDLTGKIAMVNTLLIVFPEAMDHFTDDTPALFMAALADSIRHTNELVEDCMRECEDIGAMAR